MKNFTQNIDYYIDQYDFEKSIFEIGQIIYKRGWMNRDEFLAVCLWKSRRPKKLYGQNSIIDIESQTKKCFIEQDETRKITLLIELKGVSIPTASAILSVTNPKDYPIIDVRCVQTLNHLGYIKWTTITLNNWLDYLGVIRNLADKYGKTAREIEKGLFAYNRTKLDKEFKNLYN